MTEFNTAVKEWLMRCPDIRADKLYFNYLKTGADMQSFQTLENAVVREDVLGNEIGQYTFALIDLRPLSCMPLSHTEVDLARMADAARVTEWIRTQARAHNYPVLPVDIVIDKITAPPAPVFAGADTSEGMHLAKYMVQVVIDYTKYFDD